MKTLFVDQCGKLGGAELSLLDVASAHREQCCVLLFEEGPFKTALERRQIPVQVLNVSQKISVGKESGVMKSIMNSGRLLSLIRQTARLSKEYHTIYANTPKAMVVAALSSFVSRRPLIYHLRDIVSPEHFSWINRKLLVTLANQQAALVIANSHATKSAFVEAGGNAEKVEVVYNGFNADYYQKSCNVSSELRKELSLEDQFVIGHFSRLAPWKGQHVLISALANCPKPCTVILVGDALFGENDYVERLHQQVKALGMESRVRFLGFRHDIPQLMSMCDVIAHTSTAPEPFGRVIVEAMLCDRPVIAAAAGGAMELVEQDKTGWLCPPNDSQKLAELITFAYHHPEVCRSIATEAKQQAKQRFSLEAINAQITALLTRTIAKNNYKSVDISNLSQAYEGHAEMPE